MRLFLALICFWLALEPLSAQTVKNQLGPEDVDRWQQIDQKQISNDGRWVAYVTGPELGDHQLQLYNGNNGKTLTFERAEEAHFSADSKFMIFRRRPALDSLQAQRKQGIKQKDLPLDTLGIYSLTNGRITLLPDLKGFSFPKDWKEWVVYQTAYSDKEVADTLEKRTDLVLYRLSDGYSDTIPAVVDYALAEEAPVVVAFSESEQGSVFRPGAYLFNGTSGMLKPMLRGAGTYRQPALSKSGDQLAFLANRDTTEQLVPTYGLFFWKTGQDSASLKIRQPEIFLPKDWRISENGDLQFSEDGKHLYFGIAPQPILPDTTLLDEEIVNVEVWSYTDKVLYTEQEVQVEEEKKRTYTCVIHLENDKVVQLGSKAVPEIIPGNEGNANLVLGYNETPYLERISWEGGPSYKDVYIIDSETGKASLIAEELRASPQFSPQGKYVFWYNYPDSIWYAYSVVNRKTVQLTSNDKVPFYDELNDRPMHPSSYGIAGWTKDDDFVLINDRYDVWLVDPSKELAHNNLTNGRAQKRESRLIIVDPDERAIDEVDPMLFHFYDEISKQEGYYWFNIHTGTKKTVQQGDYSYTSRPIKAKDANRWLFTKENFQTFPDLWYTQSGLEGGQKISNVNPQQSEYQWGSIELFEWTSTEGERLQGLLVKPDNFDPSKKYPMIVNFYERSSDGLHNHRAPEPHRSTINYSYYASRGYLIFNPDVPYRVGYPGESAYNAVLSGVSALLDEGFVDKERIGLQGHSWGGYQIAHILTKTDLFRCAESGAPVVNMISAYGGIRWGSGLSRMFQYEHTQSRIGGTLWEKPIRYIENSPIFFADKINTPVLILHNDEDGAVPWYQGIEFFVAMRRLNKPAWLLNYNGEPHWPLKLQNRKDFQLRMSQFFDFYLKDAPKPRWMEEGVPAVEKGINQRLDLLKH